MKTLFIDTHSEKVTITIINDKEIQMLEKVSDRSHSEVAIPLLEEALNKAGIKIKELDQIIVVNGPGSFTGVRIGVTIAKTIAFTQNIPIKTITSLEMFGVSSSEDFDIVTVTDSKGVYSARKVNGKYADYTYQRTHDFEKYVEENDYRVLKSNTIDIVQICEYLKDKECTNPHLVNPIYIKEIDALK